MVVWRPRAFIAAACVVLQMAGWIAVARHHEDASHAGRAAALGTTPGGDPFTPGADPSSISSAEPSPGTSGPAAGQPTPTTSKAAKSTKKKSTTTTTTSKPTSPPTTASGFGAPRSGSVVPSDGASTVTGNGLWVVRSDGSGLRRLADSSRRRAAWSPDGTQLTSDNGGQLFVVNADGTGLRTVNVGGFAVGSETWSPNGRQIALVSQPDTSQHVTLVNADGSGSPVDVSPLANGPAWAPDGRLAYCQATDPTFLKSVLLVRQPSGLQGVIATDVLCNAPPVWSPDGKLITFDTPSGLTVANGDGTGARLIGPGHLSYHLAWSPDAHEVAFTQNVGVYAVTTNAAPARVVALDVVDPSWSPTGQLAMSHNDGKPGSHPTDVEVVDGSGANRHAIVLAGKGSLTAPQWSPDGGWLAFTAVGY